MARLGLIVNPRSSGVTPARTEAVSAALRSRCELVVWHTERRDHARELAALAAGQVDALLVFAGDGTTNEAVNGAAGEVPFGFIPGGGASVFARALGLPRDPVRAAMQTLEAFEQGRTRSISLGRINGRRFCFSAGIGVDAEIVRRIEARGRDRDGRRAGTVRFIATSVRTLLESRFRIPAQLEVEGFGRVALLVVLNGQPYTYAGPIAVPVLAGADFAGGLDFVGVRDLRPAAASAIVLGAFRGTLARRRGMLSGHDLDGFTVRCDRPLPVQADGEDLGDHGELRFEAERDALTVVC